MEVLSIYGVNRHVRHTVQGWVVQRSNLDDHGIKKLWSCHQMRAAVGAKLAGHGVFDIGALELLWRTLRILECADGHRNENVWRSSGEILTFAAVTLRLHQGLTLGHVSHRATITTAFESHIDLRLFEIAHAFGKREISAQATMPAMDCLTRYLAPVQDFDGVQGDVAHPTSVGAILHQCISPKNSWARTGGRNILITFIENKPIDKTTIEGDNGTGILPVP